MPSRVMIFVDGANLDSERLFSAPGLSLDFAKLAPALVRQVGEDASYEGAYYYCSVAPIEHLATSEERERARRREGFLQAREYKPGYTVKKLKKVRRPIKCPSCGKDKDVHVSCPECGPSDAVFIEKGVDVALATDMMSLGVQDAYDVAVLVSNDRDFAPAVEFLRSKGKKVYHAQFNPDHSRNLRRVCFTTINLASLARDIERPASGPLSRRQHHPPGPEG